MSKKYYEIEMVTNDTISASSKEEAIEKWESEHHPDNDIRYDFRRTGKVWEVPFEDRGRWVELITAKRKEV
tara:strand:+ start:1570 stop:1782 length:213 start_codon:yes stop_codon:yes gene_type:complete